MICEASWPTIENLDKDKYHSGKKWKALLKYPEQFAKEILLQKFSLIRKDKTLSISLLILTWSLMSAE